MKTAHWISFGALLIAAASFGLVMVQDRDSVRDPAANLVPRVERNEKDIQKLQADLGSALNTVRSDVQDNQILTAWIIGQMGGDPQAILRKGGR